MDPISALSQYQTADAVAVRVAKVALDNQSQEGEAMNRLIQQAARVQEEQLRRAGIDIQA